MGYIRVIFLFNLVSVMFFSCKDSNSYIKHISGFEYRIIIENKNEDPINVNDILDVSLKYFSKKDSILFNSDKLPGKFRVKIFKNEGGLFQEALKLLNIGDSAEFLIPASNFYEKTLYSQIPEFISDNENIRVNVKINKRVSLEELDKENEMYLLKMELQENYLLQEYLKNENITVDATESGLYIIPLETEKGKQAKLEDKVVIHYIGKLINGQIFDSSIDKGKAFEFVLGKGDVIPAWDEAIVLMRVGDKVRLIVPSKLAYGKHGVGKLIPPFSTLIFEIKLIKIK